MKYERDIPCFRIPRERFVPSAASRGTGPARDRAVSGAWFIASVAVVAGLFFLWGNLSVRPAISPGAPGIARAHVPVITYLGRDPGAPGGADVRLIRSPILQSLPHPIGFSGPLLDQAAHRSVPPFRDEPVVLLAPEPEFAAAPFGQTVRGLQDFIGDPRPGALPYLVAEPVRLAARPAATFEYMVYWQDEPDVLIDVDLSALPPPANAAPWEAVYVVHLDVRGWVTTLLAEKPAPAENLNQALIRTLRSTRFSPGGSAFYRRLVVAFRPPSGTSSIPDGRPRDGMKG